MSQPFVHLHLHTEYSMVDSTVRIPVLMQRCAQDGMPAVALTDKNNLFGMVKFYKKAVAAGIKPIIGVDLRIANADDAEHPYTLILLCQNEVGYRNLSELITRAFLHGQVKGEPLASMDWLTARSCSGLIALSGAQHGDVGRALLNGHMDQARANLAHWREIFADRYYIELVRTGRNGEEDCVNASLALASEANVAVVASNDVRFIDEGDFNAHEARVCIRDGRGLADPDRPRLYSTKQYLRSTEEMQQLFADIPQALQNTVEIARRCGFDLKLGHSVLPAFPVPDGQDEEEFLVAEAERGLTAKLEAKFARESIEGTEKKIAAAPYKERLEIELKVIRSMGFPGYFLIVADFIRWARKTMCRSVPAAARAQAHWLPGCWVLLTSIRCSTTCCSSAS